METIRNILEQLPEEAMLLELHMEDVEMDTHFCAYNIELEYVTHDKMHHHCTFNNRGEKL